VPALSPKKTVEGAIGGLAGGVVLLLVAKAFFALFGIDIPWILAVGAGLLVRLPPRLAICLHPRSKDIAA
jgi:CDP-diglyceride synthetase